MNKVTVLRIILHFSMLSILVWLGYQIQTDNLGGDPQSEALFFVGDTTIRLLLLTLAIGPISFYFKMPYLNAVRGALGKWVFFWVCLHLTFYFLFRAGSDLQFMFEEITQRFYLTLGFTAWFGLLLLALTSFKNAQTYLGEWWKRIHSLIFPIVFLAILHQILSRKIALQIDSMVYCGIYIILLMFKFKVFNYIFKPKQQIDQKQKI